MASSLRLITSNLVTRSFSPTILSASRFLSINDAHLVVATGGHRTYATTPVNDSCDQSWVRIQCPKISSLSFRMNMTAEGRSLTLDIPDDGLSVELNNMPGVKMQEMRACGEQNTLFIQGKTINFPDNITSSDDHIKEDEMLEVTPPSKDGVITNIIANEIIASFRDISAKRSWAYYDMFFDRSILGRGLCPIIGALSSINSFTLYKKENAKSLSIKMSMPGKEEMKLTTQGLSVSLEMSGLERKNVKMFFDHDTFFIEGKTKTEHYITGIRLPEGISKKHNMIKWQMKYGSFCATLACCVKKEELLKIKDRLKPKLYIAA